MATPRSWLSGALFSVACILALAPDLRAQGVELSPFYGYRFGGGFFELETGTPVDVDGAPAIGIVVDVPLWGGATGTSVEALFTHQSADILVPTLPTSVVRPWRVTVDHWQGGATQEFDSGPIRPFLTGLLGLTRFAADADNEIRFTTGAGGGVKIFPTRSVGVRLDGRVFATFVDAEGSGLACGPGLCLIGLHVNVVWQAEFTAALVVRVP